MTDREKANSRLYELAVRVVGELEEAHSKGQELRREEAQEAIQALLRLEGCLGGRRMRS